MCAEPSNFVYSFTKLVQLFMFMVGSYFFIISIWGWIRKLEPDAGSFAATTRFAIVIAAHNEELVIGHMIDSLKKQNYPAELFDILVIADNCSDSTVHIAKQHGAQVFERQNSMEKGKGYALGWMFNKIFKMEKKYDAICVFDADNLVSSNFLLEMNKQLQRGYKVVQGYIDSKNPFDSWITCSYSISFWLANRLFQLPRYNLGLTCGLCGTGFCVDMETLKKVGWECTCLTEDLEFTLRLALNNIKVGWSHDAVVYDEKPLTLKQSWKQRKRWMQGHIDCAFKYLHLLVDKALKEKDLTAVDCAIYLFQPIRNIILGLAILVVWIQTLFPSFPVFNIKHILPASVWYIVIISQTLFGPFVVSVEKGFDVRVIIGFITYPFYCLTWVPITIQGIMSRNDKTWAHTLHTREISINELEKAG